MTRLPKPSLQFMSPEQVRGLPVDHRSDGFSLGVMFYLALSGRHPFDGSTWAARASSILRDEPLTLLKDDPR